MYEDITYEFLLNRMLSKVPSDIDKREGSIIYNALAPCAVELENMYIELGVALRESFASTAEGEYLEKRALEIGIERQPAAKARKKGFFYGIADELKDIPIGSRFSLDNLNYVAVEKITAGTYIMECETAGTVGNGFVGNLIPIEYIMGLARAELGEIVEEGIDEESDEKLLERYKLRVQQPTTSGNAYHYKQWALEVAGIGAAKVFTLWNGPGTVKVIIVDNNKKSPSEELISAVYNHIEEVRPIGSKVAVKGAVEKSININAKIILSNSSNIGQVREEFIKLLDAYLKDIAFELPYISIARIGNLLLSTPGILDYADLKVNGSTSNVGLHDEEIPVLGTVELGV